MTRGELKRVAEMGWNLPVAAGDGVYYFTNSESGPLRYPQEGLHVLGLEGGGGYWFDHRAASVSRVLTRLGVTHMWEVGAGTGAMANRLIPPLTEIVAIEPLAEGARAAARLGLPSLSGTLQSLHLPANAVECIGAFDVVEHVVDVADLLSEIRRVLQPGGVAIVTVPALSALWGDEDDVAGHVRRYTKGRLVSEFETNGFLALHTEYLYASLVAPAAITRALPYRLGRRRSKESVLAAMRAQLDTSPLIDRTARKLLTVEAAIARRIPLPFGLSILGVFKVA